MVVPLGLNLATRKANQLGNYTQYSLYRW